MLTHSCSTLGDFCKGRGETRKALGGGTSFSQPVRIEVNQLQSWGSAGLHSHSLIYSLCVCTGMGVGVCTGLGFMHATAQACACVWKPEENLRCHFLLRAVHLACLRQGLSQRPEADQLGQVG